MPSPMKTKQRPAKEQDARVLGIRVEDEFLERIQGHAAAEKRKVSAMARVLIEEALDARAQLVASR